MKTKNTIQMLLSANTLAVYAGRATRGYTTDQPGKIYKAAVWLIRGAAILAPHVDQHNELCILKTSFKIGQGR